MSNSDRHLLSLARQAADEALTDAELDYIQAALESQLGSDEARVEFRAIVRAARYFVVPGPVAIPEPIRIAEPARQRA